MVALSPGSTDRVRESGQVTVASWRAVAPTAYLLTGSDAEARELLLRGLAAPARPAGGDTRAAALHGVVRASLRRRLRGRGTLDGPPTPPWWVSPADAAAATRLATALDGLTPAQRAAVVLRFHDGLTDTTALVPGADPAAAAALLAVEVPDPADLPARLDGLAALADTSGLTDETVALGLREVRSRRRRRVGLGIGAAAAVLAGVLVAPTVTAPSATPTEPTATGPLGGPARGPLAGDRAFLAGVRAALDPGRRSTGADGWRVVFAGDADGVRAVLLAREGAAATELTWLTGPAGTDPGDLTDSSERAERLPGASAVVVGPDQGVPRPTLLVVAARGDELEVSPGLDLRADGTAERTFDSVPMTDGVAATRVRDDGAAVRYRLVREDVVLPAAVPVGVGDPAVLVGAGAPSPVGPPSRSGAPAGPPAAVAVAVDTVGRATGWAPEQLGVAVLGAGTFPLPGGADADAVTVAVTLPGGGLVTTTAWATATSRSASWGSCGSTGHPAGTDPATLTVVARCASYAGDGSTFGVTLLVAAPPGTPVTLAPAAGGSAVVPQLTDGWGFVIADAELVTEFSAAGVAGSVTREGADLFAR